jgi:hypothetical protein
MRLGMALACVFLVGVTGPAPAASHPTPVPRSAAHGSMPVAAGALTADVGDIIIPTVIEISIWLACRLEAIVDEIAGHLSEDLRRARGHGDTNGPYLLPDPSLAVSVAPAPVPPSPGPTP